MRDIAGLRLCEEEELRLPLTQVGVHSECARGLPLPKVLSSLHPTVDEADYREGAFPQDLLSR